MTDVYRLTAFPGSETALSACALDEATDCDAEIVFEQNDSQEPPVVDEQEPQGTAQITSFYNVKPEGGGVERLDEVTCNGLLKACHLSAHSVLIRMEPTLPGDPRETIVDICEGVRTFLEVHKSPIFGLPSNSIDRVTIAMCRAALDVWDKEFARLRPEQFTLSIETMAAIEFMRGDEASTRTTSELFQKVDDIRTSDATGDALRVKTIRKFLGRKIKGFASLRPERQKTAIDTVIELFCIGGKLHVLDDAIWDVSTQEEVLLLATMALSVGLQRPRPPRIVVTAPSPETAASKLIWKIERLGLPTFEALSLSQKIILAKKMLKAREDLASFRGQG